ncbi:MAG: type 1 glutamine amidotransferase [Actinomycetota bacterium]|nr:type 1 glutamine amidotransferase [Actinomycetota bacterium]
MTKVAFIMDDMFEDSEFRVPFDSVKEAGYEPVVIGLEAGKKLEGKKGKETVTTDVSIDDVAASDFSGLVIPGGYSPDLIRLNRKMVALTKAIFDARKPVAAICHAGWMLAEADIARGRSLTSWPSIKTDLINAGAEWVDQEVVEDGNLITSRKPDDLDAFTKTLMSQLGQAA